MFNSLKYAKKLEEVGVSREQAEVHMQILSDIVEGNLATKEDIKDVLHVIHDQTTLLSNKIDKFDNKFIQLEQRMTIKIGTIVTIVIAAIAAVYQLLLVLTHFHS